MRGLEVKFDSSFPYMSPGHFHSSVPFSLDLFPGSHQSGPNYLVQVCCVLASLMPITLIKIALSSFQKLTMTTHCFLYHRLDLNNRLWGASSLPLVPLPRPPLLWLLRSHFLFPYRLFTAHHFPTPLFEQQSLKRKVNQRAGLLSFKQGETLEH